MKKILSFIICFLVLIGPDFALQINAEDEDIVSSSEKKVYSEATLEDNFTDDKVMVVISNEASLKFDGYDVEDFSGVNVKSVMDSSSSTTESAKKQLETLNNAFRNRTSLKEEEIVSYQKYNQILCLELADHSKENVLETISILQQREDVVYAGPNYIMHTDSTTPSDVLYNYFQSNYYELIGLNLAWDIETGSSDVIVGVLDTGIDGDHIEFLNRIDVSKSRDFTNGTTEGLPLNPVTDLETHGTYVAGIIGAEGDNSTGIAGVCWDVTLVSLRVFDENCEADIADVVNAINYARGINIPILNYSGGGGINDEVRRQAIENYNGLFVCSAGNDYVNIDQAGNEHYPASHSLDNLISVGASTINDELWYDSTTDEGSNWGDKSVDLFAPGQGIYTTKSGLGNIYGSPSGTSYAAPFVTGVAALMLANNPSLKPHEIKCIIMRNADVKNAFVNKCVSDGRLNAYKALTGTLNHVWSNVETDDGTVIQCYYCKYTCDTPTFTNLGEIMGHRVSCSECNINYVQAHFWVYDQPYYRCEYCNCTTTNNPGIMSWKDQEQTE